MRKGMFLVTLPSIDKSFSNKFCSLPLSDCPAWMIRTISPREEAPPNNDNDAENNGASDDLGAN
jgi:hypothetical protein